MVLPAIDTLLVKRPWHRAKWEGIPFHVASALGVMPNIVHGFTTRNGGVSGGHYRSLNMGTHVGDSQESVQDNRRLVAGAAGFGLESIVTAQQIHGAEVAEATSSGGPMPGVDALITDTPGILLTLMFADCVPVYIFDPVNRAVGLAHSGWKGTEKNIVGRTLAAMTGAYGTDPRLCIAAIGPCISFDKYEVSSEVAAKFRDSPGGHDFGSANVVLPYNEIKGTYLLNLRHIVFQQLTSSGLKIESVAVSDQCTYTNKKEFFSHRRDGRSGLSTGRMAAILGLRPSARSRRNR